MVGTKPRQFKKINTADDEQNRIQDNIEQAISPILQNTLVNGTQLNQISLLAGANAVEHKLARQPTGYFVVDQTASSSIYRLSWDKLFLNLSASAPCVVSLWVF